MAKRSSKSSSGSGKLLLGVLLGGGLVAGGGYLYLHPDLLKGVASGSRASGNYPGAEPAQEPVATTVPAPAAKTPRAVITPAPSEVAPPSPADVASGKPPFAASEDVFEAAAPVYRKQCASCHGTPSQKPRAGTAPQFWSPNAPDMSKTTPAAIYVIIAKGSPKAANHAFAGKLSSQQIWQLTLLLREAGHELPDPVRNLLGD